MRREDRGEKRIKRKKQDVGERERKRKRGRRQEVEKGLEGRVKPESSSIPSCPSLRDVREY